MTPGRLRFPLLAAAIAGAGCSYNPGYIPFVLPGGRIQEMHAKPGGPGYFHNFDPKACKVEVVPAQSNAALGSSVVLVASVLDKDGVPRRSRRVEWLVEGVGNIVEVDESGLYAGRGYKVDNKYAVSHTNYTHHTLTRGTDDPRDDVQIQAGQTFCVLTSATPGETTVTAYAPGVFNWDSGKMVVKVVWGDGQFVFPQAATVRAGGEHTLTTVINRTAAGDPGAEYRVRYRVLDGPQAVLVPRGGVGVGVSQSGSAAREAEAPADGNGEAVVQLVSRDPQPGKTRVAVEVVKLPENGRGSGTVVRRQETVIEWAAASVQLDVKAPAGAGPNGPVPVTILLHNSGAVESRELRVSATVPDGLTVVKASPPVSARDGAAGVWTIAPLAPGEKRTISLETKPTRLGEFTTRVSAVTADGLKAETTATTRVDQGKIQALVEGPASALAGQLLPFKVAVTNPSAIAAENVTVWARPDDGLAHESGKNPVEVAVGTVPAGGTKTVELPLAGSRSGTFNVRATVTADGGVNAAAEPASVTVRKASVGLTVSGPDRAYLGQEVAWVVAATNTGDAAVSNVVVRATLPPDVDLKDATDGTKADAATLEWKLPALKAGETREFKVTATARKLADRAALAASVRADVPGGGGESVEARGERAVTLIGAPALVMELTQPSGPVEAGRRTEFRVKVRNLGTVSARDVAVTAAVPAEFRIDRAAGAAGAAKVEGTAVTFRPVEELRPGASAEFTVEATAAKAGDARVEATVAAPHLRTPLREEQSVRVVGGK